MIKIALAGNPNSGKTTMFNALTGASQRVGNWPGVTVEKKDGKLKGRKGVIIQDLPGIYSLSPYTLEEVVTRKYLIGEKPDAVVNIVDASNIERNLYLTTQLLELGVPVVIALNMIDIVRKSGDVIDREKLSQILGCEVVETTAIKGKGAMEVAEIALDQANKKEIASPGHEFNEEVESTLSELSELIKDKVAEANLRWYSIKVFERDKEVLAELDFPKELADRVDDIIIRCEERFGDDSESIITSERYIYIGKVIDQCVSFKDATNLSPSDKIDKIVTNRILALPIFIVVMYLVYFFSITTVGTMMTDWVNDKVFDKGFHLYGGAPYEEKVAEYEEGQKKIEAFLKAAKEGGQETEGGAVSEDDYAAAMKLEEPDPAAYGCWIPSVPTLATELLEKAETPKWMNGLIVKGLIGGVGAVLGFLPQMMVLFICLAILESCGYMARVAFILDRIFRRFGLSGKSFIPMMIGMGCGVPAIMASRTIENENDRRMTVITTTFIPCGAKLPIIGLIAGALFQNAAWVATSAFFVGVAAIIISGILLKKTKPFSGETSPFVMELPAYHRPTVKGTLKSMWQRSVAFVKKAFTIVLLASIFIWFTSQYNWSMEAVEHGESMLADIGRVFSPLFSPLGWGDWKAAVASINGLVAKENVVSTFGILYGIEEVSENGDEIWGHLREAFTPLSAYSFLIFNLLCAPCFAAIGAVRREMGTWKWTLFTVGYQTGFAYIIALIVFQIGTLSQGGGFGIGAAVGILATLALIYGLFRKGSIK